MLRITRIRLRAARRESRLLANLRAPGSLSSAITRRGCNSAMGAVTTWSTTNPGATSGCDHSATVRGRALTVVARASDCLMSLADADEAIDRLVEALDGPGLAPGRRASEGEQQIGLRHCPFLGLAETQAGAVCAVHLGLMQGALETWTAPVTVDRLEAFVEPDLCLAHIVGERAAK
jgi:predicted ArsR family transcriptional regulator